MWLLKWSRWKVIKWWLLCKIRKISKECVMHVLDHTTNDDQDKQRWLEDYLDSRIQNTRNTPWSCCPSQCCWGWLLLSLQPAIPLTLTHCAHVPPTVHPIPTVHGTVVPPLAAVPTWCCHLPVGIVSLYVGVWGNLLHLCPPSMMYV